MTKIKMTRKQFNELCACGKINFERFSICLIYWETYFKNIAVMVKDDSEEIVKLEVIE